MAKERITVWISPENKKYVKGEAKKEIRSEGFIVDSLITEAKTERIKKEEFKKKLL